MTASASFVPNDEGRICERCGSLLGRWVSEEGEVLSAEVCPAPHAEARREDRREPEPSFLYRGFVLVFEPEEVLDHGADGAHPREKGIIRSVRPEHVHDPVARRRGLIVATDVLWPEDRKRFCELFDHHVHHVGAPHVTPLNDGWDPSRELPVL